MEVPQTFSRMGSYVRHILESKELMCLLPLLENEKGVWISERTV